MAAKAGTRGKVLLTALVALAIFLVPAASSPSPPAEGSLTAPRAQAWTYTVAITECVAGFFLTLASAIWTCVVDGVGAQVVAMCTVINFVTNFLGAVLVCIGSLPFTWLAYPAACSDALPVFVCSVSGSLIATVVPAVIGLFYDQSIIPTAIGPAIAQLFICLDSGILWVIEAIVALIAIIVWEMPFFIYFFIALVYAFISALCYIIGLPWCCCSSCCWNPIFPGWGFGVCTWLGDLVIIIGNALYAASSGLYEIAAGCAGALFCYSALVSLGPLNLIIALIEFIIGIFFFVVWGICALVVGYCGCMCAMCTLLCSKIWIYYIAPIVDICAGSGGMFSLTGPIDLTTAAFGLFVLCIPGICLIPTVIGAPLGVPMVFFGAVLCITRGVWGLQETLCTWCAQHICCYGWFALLVAVMGLIYDALAYLLGAGIILIILEVVCYLIDLVVGWCNALVWALWVGATTILCALALGPWSCAAASCLASVPSDIGVILDLCSWCLLNVQNQILWLWQRFFQSFAD